MPQLCNKCNCLNIQGIRCHEKGCPNEGERIRLVDDGTLDTLFVCDECKEHFRFNFSVQGDEEAEGEEAYEEFKYDCLHELQDEHRCIADFNDEEQELEHPDFQE